MMLFAILLVGLFCVPPLHAVNALAKVIIVADINVKITKGMWKTRFALFHNNIKHAIATINSGINKARSKKTEGSVGMTQAFPSNS